MLKDKEPTYQFNPIIQQPFQPMQSVPGMPMPMPQAQQAPYRTSTGSFSLSATALSKNLAGQSPTPLSPSLLDSPPSSDPLSSPDPSSPLSQSPSDSSASLYSSPSTTQSMAYQQTKPTFAFCETFLGLTVPALRWLIKFNYEIKGYRLPDGTITLKLYLKSLDMLLVDDASD